MTLGLTHGMSRRKQKNSIFSRHKKKNNPAHVKKSRSQVGKILAGVKSRRSWNRGVVGVEDGQTDKGLILLRNLA